MFPNFMCAQYFTDERVHNSRIIRSYLFLSFLLFYMQKIIESESCFLASPSSLTNNQINNNDSHQQKGILLNYLNNHVNNSSRINGSTSNSSCVSSEAEANSDVSSTCDQVKIVSEREINISSERKVKFTDEKLVKIVPIIESDDVDNKNIIVSGNNSVATAKLEVTVMDELAQPQEVTTTSSDHQQQHHVQFPPEEDHAFRTKIDRYRTWLSSNITGGFFHTETLLLL